MVKNNAKADSLLRVSRDLKVTSHHTAHIYILPSSSRHRPGIAMGPPQKPSGSTAPTSFSQQLTVILTAAARRMTSVLRWLVLFSEKKDFAARSARLRSISGLPLALIDLQFKGTPELIRKAVWSCYQEEPVEFMGYKVNDIGAFPEEPLSEKITSRVMEPWKMPQDDKELEAIEKMKGMVEKLRNKNKS